MELNEIKKLLYKEKPMAEFIRATKNSLMYKCTIYTDDKDIELYFAVIINDIGDAVYEKFMSAQLLIRYIAIHSN